MPAGPVIGTRALIAMAEAGSFKNGLIVDNVEIGFMTHRGRRREHNEDNLYIFPPGDCPYRDRGMLFAVADGMGGHAGGEYASRLAVETLYNFYKNGDGTPTPDIESTLRTCVEEANAKIYSQAQNSPILRGMGTTLTIAVLREKKLKVGQIGDSRAYLLRNGTIKQLTHDHSLVAEQIRMGLITEEEAAYHPAKNIITRALGTKESVESDFYEVDLEIDDRILLCSDGLHGVVEDEDINRLILATSSSPEACIRLVEEANQRGGPDNITIVLFHLRPIKPFWKRLLRL